ncbi:MAG: hypothetical protein ABSF95_08585 [Verrucomicrobiota bacterium]|jgi:hypothetical protein
MDNLENSAPAQRELDELQAQYDSLRALMVLLLALLILVSGTLSGFLLWQARSLRRALDNRRPQVGVMVTQYQQYQKANGPAIDEFIRKLTEYGNSHPDFVPVLTKYGLKPAAPTLTGAPPAKAAAPAKK